MSEEFDTKGAGSRVTKNVPMKRLKAAFRKAKKVDETLSMKAWAREIANNEPNVALWFKGKKQAKLCNQRVRVNVKKTKK